MNCLVDWIIANMLAIHQGSLGHIRYILKNDLKWIPFYGFYFQQVNNKGETADFKTSKDFKRLHETSIPRTSNFQKTSKDFERLQRSSKDFSRLQKTSRDFKQL